MMTISKAPRRFDDWPTRLAEAIDAERSIPFEYGVSDCSMFAANIIRAIRGDDIFGRYRGRYKTKRGAYSITRGNPTNWVDRVGVDFGLIEIDPAYAQRGDLVAIENNGDPGLGIVWLDPHLIVGKPERDEPPHIILVDTLEAHVTRAWRI